MVKVILDSDRFCAERNSMCPWSFTHQIGGKWTHIGVKINFKNLEARRLILSTLDT